MDSINEILNALITEFNRGTLVLSVLSQLQTQEYGYSLVQKLEEKGAPIEANTLYPLLRRLEKQGMLTSEWDTTESRPRKYYVLSHTGLEVYKRLKEEWKNMSRQIENLLKEPE